MCHGPFSITCRKTTSFNRFDLKDVIKQGKDVGKKINEHILYDSEHHRIKTYTSTCILDIYIWRDNIKLKCKPGSENTSMSPKIKHDMLTLTPYM